MPLRSSELQEHYIRSVIDGVREISPIESQVRQEKLGLQWLQPPFVVAVVYTDYSGAEYTEKDSMIYTLKELVQRKLYKAGIPSYCILNSYNNIVCVLSVPASHRSASALEELFARIQDSIVRYCSLSGFVGIGNTVSSVQEICISAAEASEMLGYKYRYASHGVITAANIVPFQHANAKNRNVLFDRVIGCFEDGNLGLFSVRLEELIQAVRLQKNGSNTSIKRTLAELLIHILHVASNSNLDTEMALHGRDPYIWIMNQRTTPDIVDWILEVTTNLLHVREARQETTENSIIQNAKDFIDQNMADEQLGLQSVSEAVGLTASYFSTLFHQQTGEGLASYIVRKRIERACFLLRATEIPVNMVALQLGFSSTKYFNQSFKSKMAMTPTQYRKKTAQS